MVQSILTSCFPGVNGMVQSIHTSCFPGVNGMVQSVLLVFQG